jgi:(+)-trans-carveol dehydrogenase
VDGKVAFITGAARGQGRSHALCLAEEGADIIAVDVSRQVETIPYPTATAEDLSETARLVKEVGRRVVVADADVRDLAALAEVAERGVAELGRLDIVVANAGVASIAPTLETSEEMWDTTVEVNLTGVWKTVKATVPHVIAGGRGGSVVITSSLAATKGFQNSASYTASKTGLVGLMRVLAKELGPHDIRVNTIHPTNVNTVMIHNDSLYRLFRPDLETPTRADFEETAGAIHALGVTATEPEDVSKAVLYLVSDDGRHVSGSTFAIDAGGAL